MLSSQNALLFIYSFILCKICKSLHDMSLFCWRQYEKILDVNLLEYVAVSLTVFQRPIEQYLVVGLHTDILCIYSSSLELPLLRMVMKIGRSVFEAEYFFRNSFRVADPSFKASDSPNTSRILFYFSYLI
jgi:hypothetical protein